MAFLEAICKRSLSFTEDVIAFFLFAKEVQVFTGELQYISASLNLIVNKLVSQPLGFAGTVLEIYLIPDVFREVCFNSRGQRYDHVLKRVNFGFQNLACSENGVSYDNNVMNIVDFHGRDEANVNSHKFSFD